MKNLSLLTILLLFFVCFYNSASAQQSEERNFAPFTKLDLNGAASVSLTQGNSESAKIKAENIDLSDVITEVNGNVLSIGMKKGKSYNNTKLVIELSYKKLEAIEVSGAVNLTGNSLIKADNFAIELSSAGNVFLELDVKKLNCETSGAGNINLSGKSDFQKLELNGAGNINAYKLESNTSDVEVSGVGTVKVFVKNELRAEMNGVGSIRYKGNPSVKKISTSGIGSIKEGE